ncbi:amino acid permease [Pseudomonas synxantha]|nr:amino acid permease [Pseudomonas synxantha]
MASHDPNTVAHSQGVDSGSVDQDYFASRQLKKGPAGWVLLVGLGVAYVISGDYAGWNFGLGQGGWGGMLLATLLMSCMYLCMCFSLAELSSMIPTAGGGYLPRSLSITNKNKAPVAALIVPGIFGFARSLTGQSDLLILIAVFGATLSYVLMMAAHITLRVRRPDMPRPYRTPGGIVTSSIALVLATIASLAGFLVDPRVVFGAIAIYALFTAYFAFYSRHHLVSGTPEEEFAAVKAADVSLH